MSPADAAPFFVLLVLALGLLAAVACLIGIRR